MPVQILVPLINPNEPEALVAELFVHDGQLVLTGAVICTLETTKAAADVLAESNGYIAGLRVSKGQSLPAGELLCYLAEEPGWQPAETEAPASPEPDQPAPEGLRISQAALALARLHHLDLSTLPTGQFITESLLRGLIEQRGEADFAPPPAAFDPTAIIVYGGGGHGKSLIDLLRSLGVYRLVGVLDDGLPAGTQIMGLPILGGGEQLAGLHAQGVRLAVNAVGGIGNVQVRIKVFNRLAQTGFTCPAVVHPTAFIEPSARLSPGVQVFPHAYVGSDVTLGYGAIVNTGAIVSHDCSIGDYANISPGAMLAGGVRVGSGALVGMGVTANLNLTIGTGARIGNGATLKSDVPANGVVRAGTIYPE